LQVGDLQVDVADADTGIDGNGWRGGHERMLAGVLVFAIGAFCGSGFTPDVSGINPDLQEPPINPWRGYEIYTQLEPARAEYPDVRANVRSTLTRPNAVLGAAYFCVRNLFSL
jgi:hypothetical protein